MKSLQLGDRVKILVGRIFKDSEATITMISIIDGRKRYQITSDLGLNGWFSNKDLKKV